MTTPTFVGSLCCLLFATVSISAQETNRGGIVYGPKAAFNIAAPEGWVLDNQAGVEQGLPCVLYPRGESWAIARTVMYAKIAGTQFEDVNAFVAMAIKEMAKTHGKPKEKIAVRQNARRPRLFHQRISGDEDLLAVGTRRLRSIAESSRVHCS